MRDSRRRECSTTFLRASLLFVYKGDNSFAYLPQAGALAPAVHTAVSRGEQKTLPCRSKVHRSAMPRNQSPMLCEPDYALRRFSIPEIGTSLCYCERRMLADASLLLRFYLWHMGTRRVCQLSYLISRSHRKSPQASSAFTVPLVGQPAAMYLGKGAGRSLKKTWWILTFPYSLFGQQWLPSCSASANQEAIKPFPKRLYENP